MAGLWSGQGVLRRKPIEHIEEGGTAEQLTRTLGLWQLTAIGVGGIIGAGIFTLAGTVANGTAGPAVLISFLIAGVASAAAAFSYAEFAGLIPKAGSAYTYGYAVLGELAGWFIGWDLLLEYTAIVAVVAIGISGYFNFLLGETGAELPNWMLGAPGTGDGHRIDLFAAILCLLIAYLLNLGIKNAARFETVVVVLKVLVVLLVIGVGVFHIETANYKPFFPFGVSGAFTGAATVFFAVFGYDAMSTAAEESKDAQRHMPKAILYSLAISMVLYVLACLVLTGMQNYKDIDPESGFSTAFKSVGLGGLADVIAVGAIIGILTVMFTFMLGVTRVWFSMSRDGLLPKWFAKNASDTARSDPRDLDRRCGVGGDRRLPADRRGGGTDQHRHSAGVRGRVCGGHRAALSATGSAAYVPLPGYAVRPGDRCGVLDLAHHLPGLAHVGPLRGVAADRPGHLLRVLLPEVGSGDVSERREGGRVALRHRDRAGRSCSAGGEHRWPRPLSGPSSDRPPPRRG